MTETQMFQTVLLYCIRVSYTMLRKRWYAFLEGFVCLSLLMAANLQDDKAAQEEQKMKEKGFVRYGDKWVKPQEMEQLRKRERGELGFDFEHKRQTKHFVIYSAATEKATEHISQVAETMYEAFVKEFEKTFSFPKNVSALKVFVYKDREEFRKKANLPAAWAEGYFDGGKNVCHLYYDAKARNPTHWFAHEAIHQLNHNLLQLNMPAWLNEGLACYFAATKVEAGKFQKGKTDSTAYPVWWLKQKSGKLHALKKIVSGEVNYNNDKDFNLFYVQCWSLVHFLFHAGDGKYRNKLLGYLEQLKKLGDKAHTAEVFEKSVGKCDVLQKEYLEYVKKLEVE